MLARRLQMLTEHPLADVIVQFTVLLQVRTTLDLWA